MTRELSLSVFGKMFPFVPPSKPGRHLLTSTPCGKEVMQMDTNIDLEDMLTRIIQKLLWELPANYPNRDHVEKWLWQIHSDFTFELMRHQYGLD